MSGGNDVNARYAIDQMQRAEQRLAVAEADLREHQLVTQELITKVNTLDAAAADARRSESDRVTSGEGKSVPDAQVPGEVLEKRANVPTPIIADEAENAGQSDKDDQSIEDDLARRRQRLSKPE